MTEIHWLGQERGNIGCCLSISKSCVPSVHNIALYLARIDLVLARLDRGCWMTGRFGIPIQFKRGNAIPAGTWRFLWLLRLEVHTRFVLKGHLCIGSNLTLCFDEQPFTRLMQPHRNRRIQGDARQKVSRLATVNHDFMPEPEPEALCACVKLRHLQSSIQRRLIIYWPLE